MDFGERLKNARLKKGLKQRELAYAIKSKNTSISNWENGLSRPSASIIQLLASALGVSPFDLLGDYTVKRIQELELASAFEELSYEDAMAVIFAKPLLFGIGLQDEQDDELIPGHGSMKMQDVEYELRGFYTKNLLKDGGQEILEGYAFLNDNARSFLLDYLAGLLRVPSYSVSGRSDENLIANLSAMSNCMKGRQ